MTVMAYRIDLYSTIEFDNNLADHLDRSPLPLAYDSQREARFHILDWGVWPEFVPFCEMTGHWEWPNQPPTYGEIKCPS